jgi:tripartite-type tricarboxylate transporter receptor subunit TctC
MIHQCAGAWNRLLGREAHPMAANRRATVLGGLSLLLPLPALSAGAGKFPTHPGKIIAPNAPGGTVDTLAREYSQVFITDLGQPFIVDNRPGAGSNIGLAALARSAPDGYTVGIASASALAINPWLYKSLPFDAQKDFDPVAFIGRVPLVLVINPSTPAHDLKQLIAVMNSGKMRFNYGSSGIGTVAHLFGELFKTRANVDMQHVPYKSSGQALQELVAGRMQVQFSTPAELLPLIASGALRPIAVAGPTRLTSLPSVPTLTELGMQGFESPTWFSIVAPRGTPKEVRMVLNDSARKAMGDPAFKERLAQAGVEPAYMTPDQLRDFMTTETAAWGPIVKKSGATLD